MRTDIDHIDALVKEADPVHPLVPSGARLSKAGEIWERVLVAVSLGTDRPAVLSPETKA